MPVFKLVLKLNQKVNLAIHQVISHQVEFDYNILGTQMNFRPSVKEAGIQCDLPIRMVSLIPLREECIASESDFSDIEGHNTSKVSSQYVPSTSQS